MEIHPTDERIRCGKRLYREQQRDLEGLGILEGDVGRPPRGRAVTAASHNAVN
jgi:hypothetical protein